MAKGLSDTWVVIKIGNREYAINSVFIQAITELKHDCFLAESSATFVRGIYNIFNQDIPVIDGYKIARETPQNESKINFSKFITDLKMDYMSWLDTAELCIIYDEDKKDIKSKVTNLPSRVLQWVQSDSLYHDQYMNKLADKIKNNIRMNQSRVCKLLEKCSKECDVTTSACELKEIRTQADRYILDSFDSLIDCYTSKISEMCVVVKASGRTFGICIDEVEFIMPTDDKATNTHRTVLSAGTIQLNNKVYNVIDLTKLSKTLQ